MIRQLTPARSVCLNALSRSVASVRILTAHIVIDSQHYVVSGKLSGERLRAAAMSNYAASEKMYNKAGCDTVEESEVPDFWKRVEAAVAAAKRAQRPS